MDEGATTFGLASLIGPAVVRGRAQEIVQHITEAIDLGLLSDGERLPNEVELASQFGVAPMTVREALAALREAGLLETRRGRRGGSFVKRPATIAAEPLRQRLAAMTMSGLRDLLDEHAAIAGQAAQLAAERAAAINLGRLFALTEQLAAAESAAARIRADSRFHIELAVAAHSIRLTRREVGLQAEVSGMLWLPPTPPSDVAAAVQEHRAIAAAVVDEDGARARRCAEAHVAANRRRLGARHLELVGATQPAEARP